MLSLLKNKKVQAKKMATSKEKPSSSPKNCKQVFSEQEWDQARQSSKALWNQIIRDNNIKYKTTDIKPLVLYLAIRLCSYPTTWYVSGFKG